MKKLLAVLSVLMLVSTSAFAMGSRGTYSPDVKPSEVKEQWAGLSQITPYCDFTVGSYYSSPGDWNNCYNCERLDWAKKWNLQFDIDKYSGLCNG